MRLFVGVEPSTEAVTVLDRLPRPQARQVRWLRPDQWHVTLRFLGRADPEQAREILAGWAAGEGFGGSSEGWKGLSATAVLGPATEVLGDTVVMVPVAGIDELAASVVAATAELGEQPDSRTFLGHLTLCRFVMEPPPNSVGRAVVTSFAVDAVTLFRSRNQPDGVAYEILDRFPLQGVAS
ncbi:MAG TPA: hypothetical protein DGF10_06995 [Acidimicrobiaceae bacterium]|nr:hypothetical protein [Acidimicrobiaceae bacterium]HAQ23482.1 hypothetical protein [Acidimicrobiaceae bacterium]HCV34399.1 hypothetical protein [Acidimicrobiaceae bacterium]